MGKSRKSRPGHRRDPVARPVKPPSDPQLAALRESKILPIVKDLQSPDPKSRTTAASAISLIIQDTQCRKLLLREQIVHIVLTQTLTDAAIESRAAGWSIMSCLVGEEGVDFCVHLFRQDILTAIEYAVKPIMEKILSKETRFDSLYRAEKDFVTSITSSLITILVGLAEDDQIAGAILSNDTIMRFISSIFAHIHNQQKDNYLTPFRTDFLNCLLVLSEVGESLANILMNNEDAKPCYSALVDLSGDQLDMDVILACNVLHNIYESWQNPGSGFADDVNLISRLVEGIPTLASIRFWDDYHELALKVISSIGSSISKEVNSSQRSPRVSDVDTEKEDEEEDEEMEHDGSSDDDSLKEEEEEEEEEEEGDEDDEMNDDEIAADMDMVTIGDHLAENIDDLPRLKRFLEVIVPKLIPLAGMQARDDASLRIQTLAFAGLNNISWTVSVVDFAEDSNAGIRRSWTPVARSIWQSVVSPHLASDTADVELADRVTGLAWALSRTLRGETPMAPGEHARFISLYHATKGVAQPDDPFRSLGVKVVGVLGQIAAQPASTEVNREVGGFLVALVAGLPETPAACALEALDQIFDVYGNEEYAYDAEVFWDGGLYEQLNSLASKVRAMVKGARGDKSLRNRADEIGTNFTRFLAYKKKHKPLRLAMRERMQS